MNTLVEIPYDDFGAGVRYFRTSLGHGYLSHRFSPKQMLRLLLFLFISGISPWDWERVAMLQLFARGKQRALLLALHRSTLDAHTIFCAVAALRRTAKALGVSLPSTTPDVVGLQECGIPYHTYQYALALLCDPKSTAVLEEPWGEPTQRTLVPGATPNIFQPALEIMGLTARAIEQMIYRGEDHARSNDNER